MQQNPCTIAIGLVRFSYLALFKPKAVNEGDEPKYSLSAIIDKNDKATIAKVNAAIEAAKALGKDSKFGGKIPANLRLPLRDGDTDRAEDPAYAGKFFLNANAKTRPGVVNVNREPIMDEEEVYSGAYGFVNLTFFPYNSNGNKGIGVALNHVMKTKDGERLAGRVSVDEAFDGIDVGAEGNDLM